MAYDKKDIHFWEKMEQANKRSTSFYFETKALLEAKELWTEEHFDNNVHTLEHTNLWNLKEVYSAEFLNDSVNEGKVLAFFTFEVIRCFKGSESIRNLWYLAFGLKNFVDNYFTDLSSGIRDIGKLELADYICKKLSKNYGSYLEKIFQCLYADVGIVDESRKFYEQECSPLYPFVMLLVEKEGMLSKFQDIQKRLGINVILAGKGKSSRASVEKCIFLIMQRMQRFPDANKEIILLTITDLDPDGVNGVESGAVKQIKYFSSILGLSYKHLRVGLLKEDIPDNMQQPSYEGGNLFLLKPQYQTPTIQKAHFQYCNSELWLLPDGNGVNRFWGAEFNIMYSHNPTFFDEKIVQVLTDYLGLENIIERAREFSYPDHWELERAKEEIADKLAKEFYPELVSFVENLQQQLQDARYLLSTKIIEPLNELMSEKVNDLFIEHSENLDDLDYRKRDQNQEELSNTHWLNELQEIGKGRNYLTQYMAGKEFLGFNTDDLTDSLKDKVIDDFLSQFEISDFDIKDIEIDLKSSINESFSESLKETISSIRQLDNLGLDINLEDPDDSENDNY